MFIGFFFLFSRLTKKYFYDILPYITNPLEHMYSRTHRLKEKRGAENQIQCLCNQPQSCINKLLPWQVNRFMSLESCVRIFFAKKKKKNSCYLSLFLSSLIRFSRFHPLELCGPRLFLSIHYDKSPEPHLIYCPPMVLYWKKRKKPSFFFLFFSFVCVCVFGGGGLIQQTYSFKTHFNLKLSILLIWQLSFY